MVNPNNNNKAVVDAAAAVKTNHNNLNEKPKFKGSFILRYL